MALTNAQRVVMLSGSRPAWATGMDMAWDWTTNRSWTANPITDTHSADIYAQNQVGLWSPFAANTLVQTDLGLQTVPTRVQLITNSTTISTSFGTNTGCTAAENATGPDGSINGATTITSSGVGDNRRQRNITIANDNTRYTFQVLIARTSNAPTYYPAVYLTIVGGTTVTAYAVLNPFTGTIASTGASGFTATVRPSGAFWIVSVSVANNTTGNTTMALLLYPSYNTDGTTTQNFSANGATVFAWPTAVAADFTYPIPTTGSPATVNGNQQVVDLTGRLSAGVGGIIQANVLETGSVVSRLLEINDGASSTNALVAYLAASSNQIVFQTVVGGANTMLIYPEANAGATGVMTIAFAASSNYLMVQVIGKTTPAAITSGSYPSGMSKFGFFGRGYDSQRNAYALTRRAALRFGAQNATTFADLVAKATILAAVS